MLRSLKLFPVGLLCSSLAMAQEPLLTQPQSIPTDLALALANAGGFGTAGEPQILVGSIPEWVSAKVKLPPNWKILGSAFAGTIFVGVLHVATNSDSLIAEFDRLQTPLGWKEPPPPFRPPTQGFQFMNQQPTTGPRVDQRIQRCGDGQLLSAWVSRTRSLSTTIVFRIANAAQQMGSTCNPYRPPPGMGGEESPRFPTVYMPAGIAQNRDQSCWSARFGDQGPGTGAEIKSSMPLEQLLDHFSKQLEDSGWTRKPGSARLVSRSWTKPDSAGEPRGVRIEIQSPAGDSTCRSLMINVLQRRQSSSGGLMRIP